MSTKEPCSSKKTMWFAIVGFLYLVVASLSAYAQVTQQWVARYNGSGSANDGADAVAADNAGNVYVTGHSWDFSLGGFNYATIKYDAGTGTVLWVARDQGAGSNFPQAIGLDAAGNVYVTGRSVVGSNDRYLTIKYDGATGAQRWFAFYDDGSHQMNRPSAIAVDAVGNVYVTGLSGFLASGVEDYATIKYDGATGAELWVARHNRTSNGEDTAHAVTADASGNVYVTGESIGLDSHGRITSFYYVTIKYDGATGNELWVAQYTGPQDSRNGALAMALDNSGNVYVTGFSISFDSQGHATSSNYATVKYDGASGAELWVSRYMDPALDFSFADSLGVDPIGNVCVTGFSRVLDSQGFVTASSYATVKYDGATGNELWRARFDDPDNLTAADHVALDANGDVYVAGNTSPVNGQPFNEHATVKYDGASGAQLWVARYDGTGTDNNSETGMALDSAGNVYVTGYGNLTGHTDYVTVKYSQP